MPRKPTAHAELDELRQQAATERVRARDLDAQLEAAEDQLEDAAQAIIAGHANDDEKAVTAARKAEDQAIAAVKDLRHRVEGARLRVDRSQAQLDTFLRERARDLLAEREPQARTVALELSRSVAETLTLAKAYVTERQHQDQLVAEVTGATPRTDGPAPSHPWEQALKELDRVYRDTPELPAPLPRWHGLEHRPAQDDTHSRLNDQRKPAAVASQP